MSAQDESNQGDGILAGARRSFAAAAVFSLFANLLMLSIPLFSLQVYDRVLVSRSGETLALLMVVTIGSLLVYATLEAVRSRLMVHVGLWLERAWAPELLCHAVRSRTPTNGGAQSLHDLGTVRGFITSPGVFHLFDSPWVPLYILVMFLMHPALGWLTTLGALSLFGLALASELTTRSALRQAGRRLATSRAQADDYVRRAEVIEAMGMLPGLAAAWQTENLKTQKFMTLGWGRSALLATAARFGRFFIQVCALSLGGWLAIHDQISGGSMIAASILLARALAPVESLVSSWKGFVGARAAYARIREDLARPQPIRSSTRLPRPSGRLVLENVALEVPSRQRPVLSGIQLVLPAGESLGIVGPSASGKSTLGRLILGMQHPSKGCARLDGADVALWDREDLGQHVGYLPQDIELFQGTIKRNIARMGEPDDAKVVEVAQMAGVHDMILRLPQGYDTEIGGLTRTLSGGQKQRIAIARAFYGEPRLLVLDEPNANLDAEGENALLRALERAREKGITTVIIAHRARVLMGVDRLLVLKEGKMELFGPRAEIMAKIAPPPVGTAVARV